MGSLEVFTKEALQVYLDPGHFEQQTGAEWCAQKLGHDGGEDFYMKACFDAMGVGHMSDTSLLNDKCTLGTEECMAAGTCKFDSHDVSPCHDDAAVAFHPYKDVNT